MTTEMRNLLMLFGGIIVVLLAIIILFGGKSPFMKFMNFFLEQTDGSMTDHGKKSKKNMQKNSFEPIVEMATLVRKSDDRLRIIESDGQVKMVDEYYELQFMTRKGQKLKIQCSREAYDKIPFNEQGSLTYKRNTLVKFKYYEATIFNE